MRLVVGCKQSGEGRRRVGGVSLVTLYIRGYLEITLLSWMWVYSDKWEQDKLRRRERQGKGPAR